MMHQELATFKQEILAQAKQDMACYPQYSSMFLPELWKLARVNRAVKTKLGKAFARGEYTVVQADSQEFKNFFPELLNCATTYSMKNKCLTVLNKTDLTILE